MKIVQHTENVLSLVSNEKPVPPEANLNVLSWLEGHWRGKAFDGIGEEIWGPVLGSSMMGVFKLVVDDRVKFYEILTISEENNSLIMRIKHFESDLKGWEEKDDSIKFGLLKLSDSKVHFDGLTFERISKHKIKVYVLQNLQGEKKEIIFNYQRV